MKESDDTRTRPISLRDFLPMTPEERAKEEMESGETQPIPVKDITKVIQELPKEERQKIGINIFKNGHEIEKRKNDFFARNFDKLSKSKNLDKDGTVARFLGGLRDSFKADAEMAGKRIKDGKEGALTTRVATKFTSVAYLAKNIIRPARILADAFGLSSAGGARLVMTAGIVTSRMAGAAKEARFANKELIEKTQIEDIEEAWKEAQKIYKNAQKHSGKSIGKGENVTAEELKSAYLREMPKDLQDRLREPHIVNTIVQKLLRKDMELAINGLNKSIKKIEEKHKYDITKKGEHEKEKLLQQWEKRLKEYDRILTQTGTVDQWASAAKAVEFGSKSVVRLWTLESLFELGSHMGLWKMEEHATSSLGQPSVPVPVLTTTPEEVKGVEPTPTSTPEPTPSPTPEDKKMQSIIEKMGSINAAPAFRETSITFDNGDGGIQGVLDLKAELKQTYGNDFSNAPKSVQDFMSEKNEVAQAQQLGFLDKDGKSLKIFKGATLKVNEQGEIIFNNNGIQEKTFLSPDKISTPEPETILEKPEPKELAVEVETTKIVEPTPAETPEELEDTIDTEQAEKLKKVGFTGDLNNPEEVAKFFEAQASKNGEVAFFDTYEAEPKEDKVEQLRKTLLERMDELKKEEPVVDTIEKNHPEPLKNFLGFTSKISGNPLNLPDKMLEVVDETYTRNINKFFTDTADWESVRKMRAHSMLEFKGFDVEGSKGVASARTYLSKLVEITKIQPKNSWFFGRETVEHYVARALQYAASKEGMLEKLKLSK